MKTEFIIFLEDRGLRQDVEQVIEKSTGMSLNQYLDLNTISELYIDLTLFFNDNLSFSKLIQTKNEWLLYVKKIKRIQRFKKFLWNLFLVLFVGGLLYQTIIRNL